MKHTVIESGLREGFLRFPTPSIFTAVSAPPTFLVFLTLPAIAPAQSSSNPDLSKQPTLFVVGYLHLDTEWRWEYPKVINEYLRNTLQDTKLIDNNSHYIFNFSGANRYRLHEGVLPPPTLKSSGSYTLRACQSIFSIPPPSSATTARSRTPDSMASNTLPAEMLPSEINFDDVNFRFQLPDGLARRCSRRKARRSNYLRATSAESTHSCRFERRRPAFDVGSSS